MYEKMHIHKAIMLIVSQNLSNYDMNIPEDAIFRINLAWVNNIEELTKILKKHSSHQIFLDLPINRTKPPDNSYLIDDLIPIINNNENIEYLAISNVDDELIISNFLEKLPNHTKIVPKIESPKGISNINNIVDKLPYENKIIMLDHDDLFSSLKKLGEPDSKFVDYIEKLTTFCTKNNILLLRTVGVIFSDTEKRLTQYMK